MISFPFRDLRPTNALSFSFRIGASTLRIGVGDTSDAWMNSGVVRFPVIQIFMYAMLNRADPERIVGGHANDTACSRCRPFLSYSWTRSSSSQSRCLRDSSVITGYVGSEGVVVPAGLLTAPDWLVATNVPESAKSMPGSA